MARPRCFQADDVLDRSLQLFWRQGFAGTSMADVYQATGLGAGSIYGFVRDKTELFQRVFEHYSRNFVAKLPTDVQGMRALEEWFAFLARTLADDPDQRGCLICNTINERFAHTAETLAMVDARVEEVRAWYAGALASALDHGEARNGIEIATAADSLVAVTFGLMTMARTGAGHDTLAGIAAAALAPLRA